MLTKRYESTEVDRRTWKQTTSKVTVAYVHRILFVTLTFIYNVDLEGVQFQDQVYIQVKIHEKAGKSYHNYCP